MSKIIRLILLISLVLLTAAQCQPEAPPLPSPESATPMPVLIPPIQPGDGTDLIDRLLEKGVIRVGIRVWPGAEFSPPAFRGFSNAVTGGALNGFEVDVAHQIADGLGLELELIEAYPPVIAGGEWQGEWDIALALLAPFDQSPERMAYSQPYGYMPIGMVVPANSTIETWNDLADKRVGVLEHSVTQRLLSPQDSRLTIDGKSPLLKPLPKMQTIPVSNLIKTINQLGNPTTSTDQIEAVVGPLPILQQANKSDLSIKLIEQHMGYPITIAVVPQDNLKTDRLVTEVNRILARLHHNGTLAEIYLRWYEQDFSQILADKP